MMQLRRWVGVGGQGWVRPWQQGLMVCSKGPSAQRYKVYRMACDGTIM
jgi:hypothetical protein